MSRRSRRRQPEAAKKPPVQRIDELLQQLVGQLEHATSVERLTPRGIQQVTSCLNTVARITSQLPDLADDVKEQAEPEKRSWAVEGQSEVAYILKHLASLERIRAHMLKTNPDYWTFSWWKPEAVSMWEKELLEELGRDTL